MPIARIHNRSYKNPPLLALDGPGPPARQKKAFLPIKIDQGEFYFVCFTWVGNKHVLF